MPDVAPAGPGRHALYSWQTLLVLRILRNLHEEFAAEVGAWTTAMASLQKKLQGRAFPTLWGLWVIFDNSTNCSVIDPEDRENYHFGLRLALDPHLTVLASGLALPGPPNQLSLFPAMVVQR